MSNIQNTLNIKDASNNLWDFIVVGASMTGSCLARCLVQRGHQVLLVDKSNFPRSKTCGGTLNTRSVDHLRAMGLEDCLSQIGSRAISGVEWRTSKKKSGKVFFHPDKQALAVSRYELDSELVEQAIASGAEFLQDVCAKSTEEFSEQIKLQVDQNDEQYSITSQCIIACDGLGSLLARQAGLSVPIKKSKHDYIGTSIVADSWANSNIPENRILMVVGKEGYTGAVRVEQNRINIAAAIRLEKINRDVHPAMRALKILQDAGIQTPKELHETSHWDCTKPVLKRKVKSPGKSRLLLAGDALGYFEPVTGEGMSWGLESVLSLEKLLANGWSPEVTERWKNEWLKFKRRRHRLVRIAGLIARSPVTTNFAIKCMRAFPPSGHLIGRILDQQTN